jgi:hypothetical protein
MIQEEKSELNGMCRVRLAKGTRTNDVIYCLLQYSKQGMEAPMLQGRKNATEIEIEEK